MKLDPIKFDGAFPEGLCELSGEAFNYVGRKWAVHKRREPYDEFDKSYLVSDVETGFSLPKISDTSKHRAIRMAKAFLDKQSQETIDGVIEKAKSMRASLKKVTA